MARRTGRDPEVDRASARMARAAQRGTPEEAAQAKAELKTAVLRRDIQTALSTAPPLTEDQRRELASLLVPSAPARSLPEVAP